MVLLHVVRADTDNELWALAAFRHPQGKLLAGVSMLSHSYSGSCQQRGSTPVTPCTARSSRLQRHQNCGAEQQVADPVMDTQQQPVSVALSCPLWSIRAAHCTLWLGQSGAEPQCELPL